jgi:hypothetical protein
MGRRLRRAPLVTKKGRPFLSGQETGGNVALYDQRSETLYLSRRTAIGFSVYRLGLAGGEADKHRREMDCLRSAMDSATF